MKHKSFNDGVEMSTVLKHSGMSAILLLTLCCIPSVSAYSPIWTIDGWDTTQLQEAGITVKTWTHDQIGEVPAIKWVEVAYDWSKLGNDQDVLITLRVSGENGQTISAFRAEHKTGDVGKLKMIFAVGDENVEDSFVEIIVPDLLAQAANREPGNPGFGGYSLQLNRILQLASDAAEEKPTDEKPTNEKGEQK
jgi:hypothetical protein